MSTKPYDAVIIGAGLSGLAAGACLARAKKRILVLEHHSVPGGYAHAFTRQQFWFEVSLHAINGLAPGEGLNKALTELGILDKLTFHRLDPFYQANFPQHNVTAAADIETYQAHLEELFPAEKESINNLFTNICLFADDVGRYRQAKQQGQQITQEDMAIQFPQMACALSQTWGDYLNAHVSNTELKGILCVLWNYVGLPPSRINACFGLSMFNSYHRLGAFYPEGGSFAISQALAAVIEEHGQEIRYNETVNRIAIANQTATHVQTESGLNIATDCVISAISHTDTVLKLTGKSYFPEDYVNKIERRQPGISSFIIYLGIDHSKLATKLQNHCSFISTTYDAERAYSYARAGEFDKSDFIIAHYHPPADHQGRGENYSTLMIITLAYHHYANYWGSGGDYHNYRKNHEYHRLKKDVSQILLARAETVMPGLQAAIIHKSVATPLTNMRYTLNPAGSIYGVEQTTENIFTDPLTATTSINNLLLSGTWIAGGGMSMAICSGKSTAELLLSNPVI